MKNTDIERENDFCDIFNLNIAEIMNAICSQTNLLNQNVNRI